MHTMNFNSYILYHVYGIANKVLGERIWFCVHRLVGRQGRMQGCSIALVKPGKIECIR